MRLISYMVLLLLSLPSMTIENKQFDIELGKLVPNKSPSVHYSFFTADSVLYNHYMGFSDLQNGTRINEATTFHYFSNTKTFTAVALLQLQEQGSLSIEDPISKYLPDLPYSKEITIKNLLNHTSGIPNPIPLSWIHLIRNDKNFNHNEFTQKVIAENAKTKFDPNQKYAYSNIEYLILANIISHVSGMSYRRYLDNNVFSKIADGKQDFGFHIDPNRQAIGYHNKRSFTNLFLGLFLDKKKFMSKPTGKWKPFNHFQLNGHGYSGIIATHKAMQCYIQELLKKDLGLLSKASVEAMFQENILANGKYSGMCLSWFKGSLGDITYYTHAGGGGGYYSEIRIYPELRFGSVISFNRSGMKDERILDNFDCHFLNI